ncbi:MAG: hypothetical protein Q8Q37_01880 [bacterium]|nr:hypothetical protein [bacterium]
MKDPRKKSKSDNRGKKQVGKNRSTNTKKLNKAVVARLRMIRFIKRIVRESRPKFGKPWTWEEYVNKTDLAKIKLMRKTTNWYWIRLFNRLIDRAVLPNTDGSRRRKPTITEIREAADYVISHKNGIYSEIDFNNAIFSTEQNLWRSGATNYQIKMFKKLVESAPFDNRRGKNFKRYSGV